MLFLRNYYRVVALLLKLTYIELYFKITATSVWNLFLGEHRVDLLLIFAR